MGKVRLPLFYLSSTVSQKCLLKTTHFVVSVYCYLQQSLLICLHHQGEIYGVFWLARSERGFDWQ